MDNALIIDGVLAAILFVGTLIGAKRGLFKSLMGIVVVLGALVGAVLLANALAEPLTNAIAPQVENAVVEKFSGALAGASGGGADAAAGRETVGKLLERYGLPGDWADGLISSLSSAAGDALSSARESAASSFRAAVSAGVRAAVGGVVRAALTLVLYFVLLGVLRLLTKALDHVFDLPVLGAVNGIGGAALGLLETALLLYVVIYLASRFGVKLVTEHTQDTRLLAFFLNHSPLLLLSSLTQKA